MIYKTLVGHLVLLSVNIYYSFIPFQALAIYHLGAISQPSVYAHIKMCVICWWYWELNLGPHTC